MAGMRKAALIVLGLVVAVAAAFAVYAGSAPARFVSQFNGTGDPAGAINYPEGMTFDPQGKLLVVDTWNDRIVRYNTDGKSELAFGKHGHAPGQLESPRSAAIDARGNIYVVDAWNQRIQKFSPRGDLIRFTDKKCKDGMLGEKGAPKGYNEADGKWVYPNGVAVDSKGRIFVSDLNNNRIHMFDKDGKFILKWGVEGRQDGQFSKPGMLAMDKQDRLYVADIGNDRIQRFQVANARVIVERDARGKTKTTVVPPAFDGQWGKTGHEEGEFDRPYGVAVDSKGNFYVADFGNHRVQKFDDRGRVVYTYGTFGSGQGQLDSPVAVAVDNSGNLYVDDWGNNRIQKFSQ